MTQKITFQSECLVRRGDTDIMHVQLGEKLNHDIFTSNSRNFDTVLVDLAKISWHPMVNNTSTLALETHTHQRVLSIIYKINVC